MIRKITCIDCPKGCALSVEVEGAKLIGVSGHECPKGEKYAVIEIENPVRILTSTVLAQGLCVKMVPVRTDQPIPKAGILKAMDEIRKIRVSKSVEAGEVIVKDFMQSGVNLIVTKDL